MFGLGKVTCEFCKLRVPRRQAPRGQDARRASVCDKCYGAWEKSGKKCGECKTDVRGMQDVGIFSDARRLGHADCGGARLLRA
jgi:hypothetical protein